MVIRVCSQDNRLNAHGGNDALRLASWADADERVYFEVDEERRRELKKAIAFKVFTDLDTNPRAFGDQL